MHDRAIQVQLFWTDLGPWLGGYVDQACDDAIKCCLRSQARSKECLIGSAMLDKAERSQRCLKIGLCGRSSYCKSRLIF